MHYARDRVTYVQSIQRLSNSVLEPLIVAHLIRGIWNGIQSNKSIELA